MPKKAKKQLPTHVVIVQWVENTLTILAQAPVPHTGKGQRRVIFLDHRPGRVPQLEAVGMARSIARKNKRPETILV